MEDLTERLHLDYSTYVLSAVLSGMPRGIEINASLEAVFYGILKNIEDPRISKYINFIEGISPEMKDAFKLWTYKAILPLIKTTIIIDPDYISTQILSDKLGNNLDFYRNIGRQIAERYGPRNINGNEKK